MKIRIKPSALIIDTDRIETARLERSGVFEAIEEWTLTIRFVSGNEITIDGDYVLSLWRVLCLECGVTIKED